MANEPSTAVLTGTVIPSDRFGELPTPNDPMAVFREVSKAWERADPHTGNKLPILRFWRDDWMVWTGRAWTRIASRTLHRALYQMTERAVYETDKGDIKKWMPNKAKIGNLEHAAAAMLEVPDTTDAPTWIGEDWGPAIACENGIFLLNERKIVPHTPRFFSEHSIPSAWDESAQCPTWEKFLSDVWPDDMKSRAALQEWFGYVLSGRTDMQKILLMAGVTRSGRGTIGRVLRALLGKSAVAAPSASDFGSNFGLSPLVGKSLAIVPDARFDGRNSAAMVERILAISGEDTITLDRKNKEPWVGRLSTRLMMLTNELPRLTDASGAVVGRFLILNTTVSFLGREDPTLEARLLEELPGILNWALAGMDRLSEQGAFTIPDSMTDDAQMMRHTASPVRSFLDDTCTEDVNGWVETSALWEHWRMWCESTGHKEGSREVFAQKMRAVLPGLKRTQKRVNGKARWGYSGLEFGTKDDDGPGETPITSTVPCGKCDGTGWLSEFDFNGGNCWECNKNKSKPRPPVLELDFPGDDK